MRSPLPHSIESYKRFTPSKERIRDDITEKKLGTFFKSYSLSGTDDKNKFALVGIYC